MRASGRLLLAARWSIGLTTVRAAFPQLPLDEGGHRALVDSVYTPGLVLPVVASSVGGAILRQLVDGYAGNGHGRETLADEPSGLRISDCGATIAPSVLSPTPHLASGHRALT